MLFNVQMLFRDTFVNSYIGCKTLCQKSNPSFAKYQLSFFPMQLIFCAKLPWADLESNIKSITVIDKLKFREIVTEIWLTLALAAENWVSNIKMNSWTYRTHLMYEVLYNNRQICNVVEFVVWEGRENALKSSYGFLVSASYLLNVTQQGKCV